MTAPDVPLRRELTFELPGTPEQVWAAIATAEGISSWMMPTDLEERAGGAICVHRGERDLAGTVTVWDPPRRVAYAEPDWAALGGHKGAPVTPLVTEFLVEARPGDTCVLHVVTSGLGTGADWEREFFQDRDRYWSPFFDHLRLYLAHFPGQQATLLSVTAKMPGSAQAVLSAIRQALGAEEVGRKVDTRGVLGQVERVGQVELLVRLTGPVPGLLAFGTMDAGDASARAVIGGYLFSADAPGYVEREQPAWRAWLESLDTEPARR